jgi:2-polyprenyl-3-methyl-5-hydroxy-6-metoxy-1,4-benzoquinol methylase
MASCRFCAAPLHTTFVDLGTSPLCESFLRAEDLNRMEPFYPLHAWVCDACLLVQLEEYVSGADIFTEYAYFASFSESWLAHVRRYADAITARLGLDATSRVIEVGSNDGYLLQWFVAKGIPVLGIDPAVNVVEQARARGVPSLARLFTAALARELAAEGTQGDLVCGKNVMAQVTDLNDFVDGLRLILKPRGVITVEFPHLMRLMEENQFDTIYHEHFSYFSLLTTERVFAAHGLTLFDVEEVPTHGGSLRVYARHAGDGSRPVSERVTALRAREITAGFDRIERYTSFTRQVHETKRRLLEFLIATRRAGKSIAGYGAPGKGNTLLNYCGIRTDFIEYTVDRNPYKHGRFLPGTHIPIFPPEKIFETRPDYVLILPWNVRDEIMTQMAGIREWGGQFVVPIPDVKVYP